ncbi:metallophosphoesterase family protein [Natronoarchaeum rubrum]|uniref:metallophosphoesterase family protein n=1 Tax=Natronoarchaeum rubrum TaxID=755311 RepID=UPI0035C073CC
MGDNHGNTESLERVVSGTEGEEFDFVVHVGDFSNAHNEGRDVGVEQLQAVEPYLEKLAGRAKHGLLYVYGNRDYYGDLDYEFNIGIHIPTEGHITVDGQRFTQDPGVVSDDDILVTHVEKKQMIDHFCGRTYFCGHTHTGRYKERMLNSAFLYRDDSKADTAIYGGYFVVDLKDEPPFDIDLRNIGSLDTTVCPQHSDRGILIGPDYHDCMFCWRPVLLLREMASTAFYGVTSGLDREYAIVEELVDYAVDLWDSPPQDFQKEFTEYLSSEQPDPLGPLVRDDDGRLVRWEQ